MLHNRIINSQLILTHDSVCIMPFLLHFYIPNFIFCINQSCRSPLLHGNHFLRLFHTSIKGVTDLLIKYETQIKFIIFPFLFSLYFFVVPMYSYVKPFTANCCEFRHQLFSFALNLR